MTGWAWLIFFFPPVIGITVTGAYIAYHLTRKDRA